VAQLYDAAKDAGAHEGKYAWTTYLFLVWTAIHRSRHFNILSLVVRSIYTKAKTGPKNDSGKGPEE
jgi:hypothetical protein